MSNIINMDLTQRTKFLFEGNGHQFSMEFGPRCGSRHITQVLSKIRQRLGPAFRLRMI